MVVDVAVLSTGGESEAIRREACRVDRAEVTLDLDEFVAKDYRVDLHLEAASRSVRGRHVLSVLTTGHDHVEFLELLTVEERRDRR